MKMTLGWLKEHLDTDATLDQICERLTMLGLEVEDVTNPGEAMTGYVVGEVKSAAKHPDADKLQVLSVDNGSEILQVVCGAPNARAGMKGVFASSGMYIPGIDVTLKKAEIRGVESNGMMLSEREMGLSEEHDGIVDLDTDAPAGSSAAEVLGLNDPVVEIGLTPNRGDCLGVRGIARDLAASGLGTMKPLDTTPIEGSFESPITVTCEDTQACPQFVGRMVRGVKNGPSPKWMQDRLRAIGLRPISALVDITNYVSFDLARPLHVFDADKVSGNLVARLATDGEKFVALDEETYTLDSDMTVIADDKGPEALAGVMGGADSGCTDETVNVFIESAIFDPVRTAATGRKLSMMSDARYRFERGVDQAFARPAIEIAAKLVLDLCGGEVSDVVEGGAEPDWRRTIQFRPSRVKGLTGVEVAEDEMKRILDVLGFTVEGSGDSWAVGVASWRNDMVDEACIVEEIVRVNGYDAIPQVSLARTTSLPAPALSADQQRRATIRRLLAARGLVEAVTYSFLAGDQADLFGGTPDSLRLVNPISADLDVMRPSLLPNLIAAIGRNDARGHSDGALFEVGPQFKGDAAADQEIVAAGVRAGQATPRNWEGKARSADVFDAKTDALAALAAAGVAVDKVQISATAPAWYHPGRSGAVQLGPKTVLAHFGEVHPGVLGAMDVKGPIAAFEVHLGALPKVKAKKSHTKPFLKLAQFQPVERDFAFVVDASVAADDIRRAALGADKALIASAHVFDVYAGESLGADKVSVAIQVTLQPVAKTLTDEDIEAVSNKIVGAVLKRTGGVLRN